MAPKTAPTDKATAPVKGEAPTLTGNAKPDIQAKLKAIATENAAAAKEIEAHFGPERWALLMKQAAQRQYTQTDVERMCGNLRRSRREWSIVQGNDKAALILAANHFILDLGKRPSDADEAALKSALKEGSAKV